MIFSNLSLMCIENTLKNFSDFIQVSNYNRKVHEVVKHCNFYKKDLHSKVAVKTKVSYVSGDFNKYFDQEESIQRKLESNTLASSNFITRLVNKYWQETIFVSISNQTVDKYINLLKAEGLDIHNTQHREFILNFGKALSLGRIQASYTNPDFNLSPKSNVDYIKYIWRKGFNISITQFLFSFISRQNALSKSRSSVELANRLRKHGLPLFTVVNSFNQLIIAEPPDVLLGKKNWLDLCYSRLMNYTFTSNNFQPTYQGLFFISPSDALEYKEYINHKYLPLGFQDNLKIFSSRLDLYYRLVRSKSSKINFRLIPDLKELTLLMSKYRYYKNISFHKKQLRGKNFFQGQPLYIINPLRIKNKITKKTEVVNYLYSLDNSNESEDYQAVFVNYETVLIAWKKFKNHLSMYDLPARPKVTVYNIEGFIKDLDSEDNLQDKESIFIPAQDSYQFIKKQTRNALSKTIFAKIFSQLMPVQIIVKRVIWSLTSRQPVNW